MCNTSTFYLELPAATGEKLCLNEAKALPGGGFLLTGNAVNVFGLAEGVVVRMDNFGVVSNQQRLRINGQAVKLSNAKALPSGQVLVNGLLNDGTNRLFMGLLRNDFSTVWTQLFALPAPPTKITLDVYDTTSVAFAAQLPGSVVYAALSKTGNPLWMRQTTVAGLTELMGFSVMNFSSFGLVCNVVRNGKQNVEIADVVIQTGVLSLPYTLTDGTEEAKCLNVTAFNSRLYLLSIVKSQAAQFRLERTVHFLPSYASPVQSFVVPPPVDFNATGAMENSAEAIGITSPQAGRLYFLRQFPEALMFLDRKKEYSIPTDAKLLSVCRSFDGGYLFGMQTADSGKLVLIKTDSLGLLPGCGQSDPLVNNSEVSNRNSFASSGSSTAFSMANTAASITTVSSGFTVQALCQQRYCPPAVSEDTCLSSYFKVFRSGSHANTFGKYVLMRNNRHLIASQRNNRVIGINSLTENGVNLFNEKGQFLKGITLWEDSSRADFYMNKVTDSTVMLTAYKTVNGIPAYTFVLMNDQLQTVWAKSILTYQGYEFSAGGGLIFGDIHRDEEGNYYMVGTSQGFMQIAPKLMVYKMDANGNTLWLKAYDITGSGSFGPPKLITTATSTIVIIEGGSTSTTVRLDKASGSFINAYRYNNQSGGATYIRFAKYEQGQIFYAGNNSLGKLLLGSFDTTGRPIKLRVVENSSIYRAADAVDGKMYNAYYYYNGTTAREALLKVDTALNVSFLHEFDPLPSYHITGLGVSGTTGSIYLAGNFFYGGYNAPYADPYLKKYTPDGEMGTCPYQPVIPVFTNVDPQPAVITSATPLQRSFQPLAVTLMLRPDTAGQVVSALMCSSSPQCNSIRLSGPDKVCSLDKDVAIRFVTNAGCSIKPVWTVDTGYAAIQSINDTGVVVRFKQAGFAWIKAKLNSGCNAYFDSLLVQAYSSPSILNLGPDRTLCPGNTILLNARKGYASYSWQDGSTDSTFSITQPGLYHVTTTDACGGVFKDSVAVTAAPPIPFTAGPDRAKCNNDTLHLSAPAGFLNYAWSNNYKINSTTAQNVIVNPLIDTSYYIKAEKTPGCFAYDTVRITVYQSPPIDLGNDKSFCLGDSAVFDAGAGFQTYAWSGGQSNQRIAVKTAGTYSVVGTTAQGCKSADTVKVLTVYSLPSVSLDKKASLCFGDSKTLNAGNFASYSWSTGQNTATIVVNAIGQYAVAVADANGCKGSDTTAITTINALPAGFLPLDTAVCSYGSVQLKPLASFSRYLWSTGDLNASITVSKPGPYWLEVVDGNTCKGRDTITVNPKDCMKGIYAPAAFTPNGDGKNDAFYPLLFGKVKAYHFTVYNRWGQTIFQANELQKGWDGKVAGTLQRSDVFVWICTYQFEGEAAKTEKGTVTLIR